MAGRRRDIDQPIRLHGLQRLLQKKKLSFTGNADRLSCRGQGRRVGIHQSAMFKASQSRNGRRASFPKSSYTRLYYSHSYHIPSLE